MKRLAGLIFLAGMIFTLTMVVHAESRLSFEYNGKAYTIEQASSPQSGFPFEVQTRDGIVLLQDKASDLSAAVRLNSLDKAAMEALRKYYNDYSSIDFELFTRYIGLQKSYIPALQDLYRSSYLYGNSDDPYAETNMKVFYQDKDKVFGNNSDVFLYNIINTKRQEYLEETHLDMVIPVYSDLSLLSINFTFKSGTLDNETEKAVYKLLSCIRFPGFPAQTGKLKVFEKKEAVMAANAGIYKSAESNGDALIELKNKKAGFTLKYPASYLPYMDNKLGGKLDYKSFKISPGQILSVSAEQTSITDAVYDKPAYIVEFNNHELTVRDQGITNINGNEFVYVRYETTDTYGTTSYVRDYYAAGKKHIYNLRLSSRYNDVSEELNSEFEEILGSLKTYDAEIIEVRNDVPLKKYLNKDEGYSFFYPVKWKLTDISADINFDSFSLKMPELSGPINIYISEGELKPGISLEEIPAIFSAAGTEALSRNIRKYNSPYAGAVNRLLSHSITRDNGITYVYRLVNYLDSNGRTRLCYSLDIVKKNKIYSMFISVSEYATLNGSMSDPAVNTLIENIASSFKFEETFETVERDRFGETRNRRVVQLENILQKQLGNTAKITQAVNAKASGSYYILVDGVEESGYYRVKPDFSNRSLIVEEKILKKDCKLFLEEYLSTNVDVYFASGDEFEDIENFRTGKGHYTTVVYAEFNNSSGFFILDIDPHEHIIKVISFKSSSNLAEEISARIVQNAEMGFIIDNSIDKKDFTLNFHFYSSIIGHFFKSYKIVCNTETLALEYTVER